ncbi:hypothetical protein ACIPSE_45515 [Streptomyces sp. NPDC090106]|uniref:hypothetical protein n=1 Tax=Streptomyces sp. NPDC090106 TaxID=3365946 RepID=UPI00382930E0
MTITDSSPSTAANALLAAHPDLSAESIDVTDVPGLGLTALIQVAGLPALQAWALALHTTARSTGASAYGNDNPRQEDGLPDWMWWRLTFIDITVDQTPIRIWTLEATDQPRTLAVLLASTAHTPAGATT